MKAWCFWLALTMCCVTLMPIFYARSLIRTRPVHVDVERPTRR